jgi:hypothetical protein
MLTRIRQSSLFKAVSDISTFAFVIGLAISVFSGIELRLPMKVVTDSDLIPVSDSDVMPVAIGAKRRWHDHSGRTDRHPSTGMQI